MRHLDRLSEPEILTQKKAEWLQNFLASGKPRPDNSKYGNPKIRETLNIISFHKCYYCETKLKGQAAEIDHYIEVAFDKNGAFEWENLYLSCDNCNDKKPHKEIKVQDALNPFLHTDQQIQEHITFNDEIICIKNDSRIGHNTIQKFRLDTKTLDQKRLLHIKDFQKIYIEILRQANQEKREVTVDELEILRSFSYDDKPYSLMFKILLKKSNLL